MTMMLQSTAFANRGQKARELEDVKAGFGPVHHADMRLPGASRRERRLIRRRRWS